MQHTPTRQQLLDQYRQFRGDADRQTGLRKLINPRHHIRAGTTCHKPTGTHHCGDLVSHQGFFIEGNEIANGLDYIRVSNNINAHVIHKTSRFLGIKGNPPFDTTSAQVNMTPR